MQKSYSFSPLDEIMPPLWMTLVLCFPCADSQRESAARALQQGLTALVQKRPFLAGVLKAQQQSDHQQRRPGSLSFDIPASPTDGVKLVVEELAWKCSYEELRAAGMPLSKLEGSAISTVPYGVTSSSNRVFEAKLSFIPGGCFLSMSTCHQFVDAWGWFVIMDTWARSCRELQAAAAAPTSDANEKAAVEDDNGDDISRPPALFENVVTAEEYEKLAVRPELWQLLGLNWRHLDSDNPHASQASSPFEHPNAVRTCMFTIAPAGLSAIKAAATPAPPQPDAADSSQPQWISTKDALAAFLWRSITRARAPSWTDGGKQHATQSMVSVAIDGRRALVPRIPPSYIGNVVFCCLTWLPVSQLLSPATSLAAIALAIRASIATKARNAALLRDAVRLAAGIPDVGRGLGNAFTSWYGRDLVTTNVADLPMYELDFGPVFGAGERAGKPEFFRMPRGQFDGICSVQPKRRDGMMDIIISLEPEQMERLMADKDFREHVDFLSE